jgi:hypothetical protein
MRIRHLVDVYARPEPNAGRSSHDSAPTRMAPRALVSFQPARGTGDARHQRGGARPNREQTEAPGAGCRALLYAVPLPRRAVPIAIARPVQRTDSQAVQRTDKLTELLKPILG